MLNYNMMTPWAKKLNESAPLPEYPRPYLMRDSYLNLNGIWDYEITTVNEIPKAFTGKIVVPFPLESSLSGVRGELKKNEFLCYNRKIELTKDFIKDVVMINFGAVNQICDIYINGNYAMHHVGGYLPFSLNATQFIHEGVNDLVVIVENDPNLNFGVGKAGNKRGGMWYTKTSGIWQTVWMESYSVDAIKNVIFYPKNDGTVMGKIRSKGTEFEIEVSFNGEVLYNSEVGREFKIKLDNVRLWDTDNPNLYDVVVKNKNDLVKTYFAFREFKIVEDKFYLNNKPIFLNGLLDQGYFSDGIYTPASYDAYTYDIVKMKELGFNTLRKHIKVEPQMFYYLADKLGMLVMQDFPNSGKYSFFRDTALPTIGFKKLSDKKRVVSTVRRSSFLDNGTKLINLLYKHPSVVYYTIFNEGWGQFSADEMYEFFKEKDLTRVFDSTSGWFWQKKSDVDSIHVYFKKVKLPKRSGKPIVLSEFGGYSLKISEHSFNSEKNYGYKLLNDKTSLTDAIVTLYERDVIALIPQGLAGAIYTQVSDVEDETNGLLTYDRQMVKVEEEKIKEVMKKVRY